MANTNAEKMEKIFKALDKLEMRCDENSGEDAAGYKFTEYEIGFQSDAGEDFFFTITTDGTADSFIKECAAYALDFDPDEHAGMMYEAGQNGLSGVPSLSVLVKDAHSIQSYLNEMLDAIAKAAA